MAPPTAPAAGRLPLQHAARPARPRPWPRRAGTSEPRPPGASRRRSERPSSSLRRRQRQHWRGKGRGAQETVLPAAAAASRNGSAEPVRAPAQRQGPGGRPPLRQNPPPPSLRGRRPAATLCRTQGSRRGRAVVSPCLGRIRDERSEGPSLYSLGSSRDPHL